MGRGLGVEADETTSTRVVAHVDIDERHLQPYGIVHGGVWASIVETVASRGAATAAHERTGDHAVVGMSAVAQRRAPGAGRP